MALRRVPMTAVQPGMRLASGIHDIQGRLMLAAPATLDAVTIGRLTRMGVQSVQIEDPRFDGLELDPVVSDVLMHDASALFDGWQRVLAEDGGGTARPCVDADDVGRLVGRVAREMPARINEPVPPVPVRSEERTIAAGALNAARLALALAPPVGLGRHATDIAVGAFVRDVALLLLPSGARALPPAPQVPPEGSPLYQHATAGLDCLAHPALWSPVSKAVVAQHHEHLDGSGYPKRLRGEAIHAPAALLAVIDAYCSLLEPRNDHPDMTPEQAIDAVLSLAGREFDAGCVAALCARVGLYAPGTVVRLNTGDEAVVVGSGRGTSRRPCLRMVASGRTIDLQDREACELEVAAVVEV